VFTTTSRSSSRSSTLPPISGYRYLRTVEERDAFLRAAHREDEAVLALYSAAVFMGTREGELAARRWDDVDFGKHKSPSHARASRSRSAIHRVP
jgi:hypothetical protein